jgi:hypothetical protein
MIIALGIVAAVLLGVAWLGNRPWARILGSAGAGCAGLCIGVLGCLVGGAVFLYGYGLDTTFRSHPANELFWLALVLVGGSIAWGFVLLSMDSGGVR